MEQDTFESTVMDSRDGDRVLLLIEGERNRRLLADELGATYDVVAPSAGPLDDIEFDACLFDPPSFATYREALARRKRDAEPLYLPYILLLGEQLSADSLPDDVNTLIDEVVSRPSTRAEVTGRVETLLHHRRLSVDLWRAKERSERRFESLFYAAPDPVVVVDPDGTISAANRTFAAVFEGTTASLVGTPITSLPIEPMEAVTNLLVHGAVSDDPPTVTLNAPASSSLIAELTTETVERVDGAQERIGVFHDVTERVNRERELEAERSRLAEFADTVAHDLRNPLSVVTGRLEYAQETGDEEHFVSIRQALDRMNAMIDDLLTLAKRGDVVAGEELVSLQSVVEDAWATVDNEDSTLVFEVEDPVTVVADRSRFRELLENLFRNANQHGGPGTTVRVGVLDDDGLFIEDDGPGIPAADRATVFEMGVTDANDGTGFGLAIVEKIVEGHGWNIEICDGRDGGARFEIRF